MRMKSLLPLALLGAIAVATTARADLVIKITQGVSQPTPIAVVPFAWKGGGSAPVNVANVIGSDLARSGLFAALPVSKMLARPSSGDDVNFTNWKAVNVNDLVVGAVLVAGAAAPKLVTADHVKEMLPGAVVVDISIDQGGCFETSRPTTHAEPTYVVDEVVHYCVTNMPGAVPRTSTFALNNATLPFALALADKGAKKAMLDNPHLLAGLNVHRGMVTYEDVARDLGYDYVPAVEALKTA